MTHKRSQLPVVVIGGGPAGLTAAYQLMKMGQFAIVIERAHRVGGIARTESYKGYRVDIGGHRFFTKVEEVKNIWREVLGEDFLTRPRLSRIYYNHKFFYYPIRLPNVLANLGFFESLLILLSYLYSQLFPYPQENTFEEWVSNRFGHRLFRIFFKTYTEKVWGIPCHQISADWAAQRIRGLSLPAAVRSALFGGQGQTIKTLIDRFEYPRLGPGMLWERLQQMLERNGSQVIMETEAVRFHHDRQRVQAVTIVNHSGEKIIEGDQFISSMPVTELIARLDPSPPDEVIAAASHLTYRDFITVALIINRRELFPDNWLYIHEPGVKVGRIQNFKNWSPQMVPNPSKTCLGLEYFCTVGDELWNMAAEELIALAKQELEDLGLVRAADVEDGVVFRQEKAYPVYTGAYKAYLEQITAYLDGFENLQTIGRNGLHMYNNQDHSMLTGILAAKNALGEQHNVWTVNVERAYHEEISARPKQ